MNIPSFRALAAILLASVAVVSSPAQASAFGVTPLRIDLGGLARSGVVTVTNDSPDSLLLDVKAVSWTMDESGNEQYAPTEDLAFFPRSLSIPSGEKRVIRVGSDVAAGDVEKTYRLFLHELQRESTVKRGVAVAMMVNFGVPVYIKTAAAKAVLTGSAVASKGELVLTLRNSGTSRARVETITLSGGVSKPFGSAYVLAGLARKILLPITAADCAQGIRRTLDLELTDAPAVQIAVDLTSACK